MIEADIVGIFGGQGATSDKPMGIPQMFLDWHNYLNNFCTIRKR